MAQMNKITQHPASMVSHAVEGIFAILVTLPTMLVASIIGLTVARRIRILLRSQGKVGSI